VMQPDFDGLTAVAGDLARGLRDIGRLRKLKLKVFADIDGLRQIAAGVEKIQGQLRPLGERTGTIDEAVLEILRHFRIYEIDGDEAAFLSPSGNLVTSSEALGLLQVRSDYHKHVTGEGEPQRRVRRAGHRPHTDLVRSLPRSYYSRPGYVAPLEDLLDWAAENLYAGKRSTDADDGAVGYLVDVYTTNEDPTSLRDRATQIAGGTEFWTADRLVECRRVWLEVVGPALNAL
jgi:hypothetical protein